MNEIKARFLYSMKRKKGRNIRHTGDEPWIASKDKVLFRCKVCGWPMEYWKEDYMGDLIFTCTNPYCYKNKDYAGSLTVKLKKLLKEQQMNSRLYYRTYKGGYY